MKNLVSLILVITCLAPNFAQGQLERNNGSPQDNQTEPKKDKPNLIMVLVDEHSFRTLGCYRELLPYDQAYIWGDGIAVETPNIDALAHEGALYKNFYTVAPLCTPSRASFFTGLYPQDTGATKNHEPLSEDIPTFAEVLRADNGYYTGFLGKFHLNGDEKPGWGKRRDKRHGFIETKFRYNRGHWKFFERSNGKVIGYEWRDKDKFKGRHEQNYATDFLFNRGLEFINRQVKMDRPFAMVLSIADPHAPNIVRLPYANMYDDMHFQLPHTAKVAVRGNPSVPRWQYTDGDIVPEAEEYLEAYENSEFFQNHLQNYFGMVKCLDDNIGKLMAHLKEKHIDENTIVVFTSDHGDQLGEHGKLNKGKPYEASAGIPFIVRYPQKIKPGKVIDTTYSSVDFAKTILSLMNARSKKTNFDSYGIDGSRELLEDDVPAKLNQIRFLYDAGKKARWAAAVMDGFKLVISRNDVPWLFNLKEDPHEIFNYYNDPKFSEILVYLQDALLAEIKEHKWPIFKNQSLYWDPPVCKDSNDVIPIAAKGYCSEIQEDQVEKHCQLPGVFDHCQITCNSCCEDSIGKVVIDKELKACEDLEEHCSNAKVKKFCPKMCNIC